MWYKINVSYQHSTESTIQVYCCSLSVPCKHLTWSYILTVCTIMSYLFWPTDETSGVALQWLWGEGRLPVRLFVRVELWICTAQVQVYPVLGDKLCTRSVYTWLNLQYIRCLVFCIRGLRTVRTWTLLACSRQVCTKSECKSTELYELQLNALYTRSVCPNECVVSAILCILHFSAFILVSGSI